MDWKKIRGQAMSWMLCMQLVICIQTVWAADYFITPDGAGEHDGSDWANAFQGRPTGFEKGSTYYIAGGDYTDSGDGTGAGWRWNITANTGTGPIHILKATPENSSTVAGYQAAYGTSPAVFATSGACSTSYFNSWGAFGLDTDDVIIDGGYDYGIRIVEGPDDWQPYWPTGNYKVAILVKNASRVIFRHILFDFAEDPLPEENPYLKIGIYDWLNDTTDLTVERCRFSKGHMAVRGTGREPYNILDSVFVDFTTSDAFSMGTFGGIIDLPYSDIGTIARNAFSNCINATAFNHMVQLRGAYEIHGNVIRDCHGYRSALYGGDATHIHNNTVADSDFADSGAGNVIRFGATSTDNAAYNNMFANIALDSEEIIAGERQSDANWCWDGTDNGRNECASIALEATGEAFGFGTALPEVFTDPGSGDYTLKNPVPGMTLDSLVFGLDPLGNTRGADGIWDKGAYEYSFDPDLDNDGDVDGMDLFLYAAQEDFAALASFAGKYGLMDLLP